MSVHERAKYMANGIALPKEEHTQTWDEVNKWKNMKDKEFMTAYGNAKLELYRLPTKAELDQLAAHDVDDASGEENGGDSEDL